MWASVGWGGTAPLAGWLLQYYGLKATELVYLVATAIALVPTCLLPIELLADGGAQPATGSDAERQALRGGSWPPSPGPGPGARSAAPSLASPEAPVPPLPPLFVRPIERTGTPDYMVLQLSAVASLGSIPPTPTVQTASAGPHIVSLSALSKDPAIAALLTPPRPKHLSDDLSEAGSYSSCGSDISEGEPGDWWPLARQPWVLVFFWTSFLMGVANGAMGYLFLYLKQLGTD